MPLPISAAGLGTKIHATVLRGDGKFLNVKFRMHKVYPRVAVWKDWAVRLTEPVIWTETKPRKFPTFQSLCDSGPPPVPLRPGKQRMLVEYNWEYPLSFSDDPDYDQRAAQRQALLYSMVSVGHSDATKSKERGEMMSVVALGLIGCISILVILLVAIALSAHFAKQRRLQDATSSSNLEGVPDGNYWAAIGRDYQHPRYSIS